MYKDNYTRTYCYIFKLCVSIDFPGLYIKAFLYEFYIRSWI